MTAENLGSTPRAGESKRRGKLLQWNIATLLLLTAHIGEIAAGRRVISLEKKLSKDESSVRVLVDGQPLLEVFETKDWKTTGGHSWGGGFNESKQLLTDKPFELIRIRFHKELPNGR